MSAASQLPDNRNGIQSSTYPCAVLLTRSHERTDRFMLCGICASTTAPSVLDAWGTAVADDVLIESMASRLGLRISCKPRPKRFIECRRHRFGTSSPGECANPFEAAPPEVLHETVVGEHPIHGVCEVDGVERINHQSGIPSDFLQRTDARRHDGRPAGHCFQDGQAEALSKRGEHKTCRTRVEPPKRLFINVVQKSDRFSKPHRLHLVPNSPYIRWPPLTSYDEPARFPFADHREGLEKPEHVLVRQ